MKRFEIIYDCYDEEFGISTLRTWADTYEEAITDKYTIHDIPKPSSKSSVVMGLGVKGWVEWNLENPDSAHCLLVGGTGSGKSRLMFHLIKQFIEQDFLVLFGDYKKLTFGRYSKRGYRVATENIQIARILRDLHEEMMRRNELFLKEEV